MFNRLKSGSDIEPSVVFVFVYDRQQSTYTCSLSSALNELHISIDAYSHAKYT